MQKKGLMFFGASCFLFLIFLLVGIPLLVNVSALISSVLNPPNTYREKETKYLQSPQIETDFLATNSAKITIRGYGAPDVQAQLFLNSKKAADLKSSDGKFIFKNVVLEPGDNELQVISKDEASNKTAKSDILIVSFDNKAPELTLETPTDNQEFVLNNQITIKGKTNEEGTLTLNGIIINLDSQNRFNYNLELAEGENKLKFVFFDKAGNKTEKEITVRFRK